VADTARGTSIRFVCEGIAVQCRPRRLQFVSHLSVQGGSSRCALLLAKAVAALCPPVAGRLPVEEFRIRSVPARRRLVVRAVGCAGTALRIGSTGWER
jgi:hypothetical protein